MGAFKSAVITEKGQALLAKVVAGTTKLAFTKIAVSADTLSGDLVKRTDIGTIKQSSKIASVSKQNNSNVKVSASISNETLHEGYYIRNIGLFATDPQDGEILYSISVADESTATADWMPPFNGIGTSSLLIDLVTAVSNASEVNVSVDPSTSATVAQIIDLQEQIDDVRNYVGYEDEDVYGVEVDYKNKKITRIAGAENLTAGEDFNALNPWKRRRCIVADDGVVLAYKGETGYIESGSLTQKITKSVNGSDKEYQVGTKAQVMVEQPLFYVKAVPVKSDKATSGGGKQYTKARYYISPIPKVGFKPMGGFRDANGILQDKIYLAAYEGCIEVSESGYNTDDTAVVAETTDKLSSIAGAKPASGAGTSNLTRANARKIANNRGAGWQLSNIFSLSATQWLILIEYASFDAQLKIGKGVSSFTDDSSTNMAINTGATASLGDKSGIPEGHEDDGKCSVTYRGEENLWGNIWTWLDGINVYNTNTEHTIAVKEYGEMKDDTLKETDGYTPLDFDAINTSGYISAFGVDSTYGEVFIPTEHNGTTTLPVGDYFWNQNTGFRVAILGGAWHSGANCGAWSLYLIDASSGRYRDIGGRLLYVPQTKIST